MVLCVNGSVWSWFVKAEVIRGVAVFFSVGFDEAPPSLRRLMVGVRRRRLRGRGSVGLFEAEE